jgi:AcrR family transcriptional regulator
MPRLIDNDHRTQSILLGANRILAEHGLGGLTLRAIAAEVRISLGSLTSHYESRSRLLHLLAQLAGRAWLDSVAGRIWADGVLAFLPGSEEVIADTRVWLSWCELARSAPELRGTVQDVRLDERALLSRTLEHRLDSDALDITLAAIHGLRQAICAGDESMPLDHACAVLADHVERALDERPQEETA